MTKKILGFLLVLLLILWMTACSSAGEAAGLDSQGESQVAEPVAPQDDPIPTSSPVEPQPAARDNTDEQPASEADALQPLPESADEDEAQQPDLPDVQYPQTGGLSGFVRDENGPVNRALVRVQLTDQTTLTNEIGYYEFQDLTINQPITLTAWAEGYMPGGGKVVDLNSDFDIDLKAHYTGDNLHYNWFEFNGTNTSESCEPCHTAYDEWKADAHSQTATNARFLSVYQGTDVHGNQGPSEYEASGRLLPPEPDAEYYGPGYRLDFPDRTGNCAACHTPLASKLEPRNTCGWSGCHKNVTALNSDQVPYGVSPTNLTGVAADGIACDFCHKIGEVFLDPETQLPYSARPGISSMRLYRPEGDDQLFFGIYDDVLRRVSYSPLEEQSAYCASCHYGQFGGVAGEHNIVGGVEVYNSYGEWLDSPWSDPESGATCQDCHMLPVENKYFVFPEMGGMERDYKPVHNHLMTGVNDLDLMQNAVTMQVSAELKDGEVVVDVAITNDQTGHHVPTGTPYRHMILLVTVQNTQNGTMSLNSGPVLPAWIGDYQGQAGTYFAKLLKDEYSGEFPTAGYWRDISLVEDTRIAAFQTAESQYIFRAEGDGPYQVHVQLLYRRAYYQLMQQKDWTDPDILMEEAIIDVNQ